MIFSIPYIVLLCCLFFFALVPTNNHLNSLKIVNFDFFILGILIFFIGFRGYLSTDWVNYERLFIEMPNILDTDFFIYLRESSLEKGYIVFTSFVKLIYPNYFFLQFFSSLIDIIFFTFFFKKYVSGNHYIFSYIFFILFSGLVIEVNLLRNSKAIMLFCFSLKYLQHKKDIIKFILCNVLGAFFHISSVFYIIIYFFIRTKHNRKVLLTLFLIGNGLYMFRIHWMYFLLEKIFYLLGNVRLAQLMVTYGIIDNTAAGAVIGIGFLERSFTFLFFLWIQPKIVAQRPDMYAFFNIVYLYIFVYLFCYDFFILTQRLSLLLSVGYWILYPVIFKYLNRKSKKKFLLILFFYSVLKLVSMTKDDETWRYTNFLLHEQNSLTSKYILFHHLESVGNEYRKK